MKRSFSTLIFLITVFYIQSATGYTIICQVSQTDIHEGYIIKKTGLTKYALPKVTISGITWSSNVALPNDAKPGDPAKFTVTLGMERKKPFAVIRIPAYAAGSQPGTINQVASYTLDITEPERPNNKAAARTTDVTTSALDTGTWYKIAITNTGFYKIDYNFLTTIGVKPSDVNPANIRILGNGGAMLSENNAVTRPVDLIENAVLFSGNGDNVFDNGEFVIFYGVGTTAWYKDSINQRFNHQVNLYSDTSYYFISFNTGPGKRISSQPALPAGNVNVNSYNFYAAHEQDLVNPATIGRLWYGEQFNPSLGNTTQSFNFDLGSSMSQIFCYIAFAATSATNLSTVSATLNGNSVGSYAFTSPTSVDWVMNLDTIANTVACNSSTANVTISFSPGDGASTGYLKYIELNGRRGLIMTGDQMNFRDWQSVGSGHTAQYSIAGANANTAVWDVTNPQTPVMMPGTFDGSNYNFAQDASVLHEFGAMNSTNLNTPKFVAAIPNQNLHGSPAADLIIVTYPGFLDQAQQLAQYHRDHDHLRVVVATTDQVYNEFSSGGQDISAIRDFAKMFYDRAGTDSTLLPSYLLLFGGASYDYKNRVPDNSNFVPVFESVESFDNNNAFSSDDFFGFLDDSEDIENYGIYNILDIGTGRLPARTVNDAKALVNKMTSYNNAATLGPWRVSATIVADRGCVAPNKYDDAGNHMGVAEDVADSLTTAGKNLYNEEKIYVDAIPIISTPAGARCPNANAALNQQVFNGTFLINYNGHGNPTVWSSERILTGDDFNNWNNANMLPIMITATCDFGQFDHPQYVSSAEQLLIRSGGGVIAVLTTTQAVYSTYNEDLDIQYLQAQFLPASDNTRHTFGTASRTGKNATFITTKDSGKIINFHKFSLLGDPAIVPDFPVNTVQIDSVLDGYTMLQADTVKALGSYIIDGSVRDQSGNLMSGFNGILYVSFFDKPRKITTLTGCNNIYSMQDNIIYKGRVTVTNGKFTFTFITPKDISYSFGAGKISMYSDDGVTDAAGDNINFAVGGFSDHPVISSDTPVVKPYINDSLFLNGGITGSNTSLYVSLFDKTGINVTGTDVGHDLTAVLDGSIDAPFILNDYYETYPNTFQRGYVSFAISGLADGPHSIKVRAWDVNDNTGTGTVDFIVADGQVMDVAQLGNYPNPFNNSTHFVFEHNHPFEQLDVQIEIYNISGGLVRKINDNLTTTDSRTVEITWDGTDSGGNRLPSGVYVYRLILSTDKGYKSSAYQKLVIVR